MFLFEALIRFLDASSAENAVKNYKVVVTSTLLFNSKCEFAIKNDPLVIPKYLIGKVKNKFYFAKKKSLF